MQMLVRGLLSLSYLFFLSRAWGEKRVVCYYTNWSVYRQGIAKFSPENINPYLCTHLIYAFGGITKDYQLKPFDNYQDIEKGGYAKFMGLKTYNKGLKVLLAVGGWNEGSGRWSPLVADADHRKTFIRSVIRFLRTYDFDGLDLDWEYPAFRDGGRPEDKDNYAKLVQELRISFEREAKKSERERLLLTMAVPAGQEYIDNGYDVATLNKYLDFFNMLTYDYHSAFEPQANHHAPLYPRKGLSEFDFKYQLTIDYTVKYYLEKGADRDKLVVGIPTYGRSYTLVNPTANTLGSPAQGPGEPGKYTKEKGYLAFYEVCENIDKDNWKVMKEDPTAVGPYAYKEGQWVGYDDEDIARRKAQYVREEGLGGIMFWSVDNDDFSGHCCKTRPDQKRENATDGGMNLSYSLVSSTTFTTPTNPLSTPEPPTTPDPCTDFSCKDEGTFTSSGSGLRLCNSLLPIAEGFTNPRWWPSVVAAVQILSGGQSLI
ncbi:unnamed protein product [Darwinula stevensoni]|uniref:chitinase n=1 Tax=Darwinula stevensoni TaxID=69355 RepID=A0A7R9AD37_9CRUS|nr:unnamed protein product [Darwinula stevensoni]CAG0900392.1 unnamed protein product [Darwinula stevensoni]